MTTYSSVEKDTVDSMEAKIPANTHKKTNKYIFEATVHTGHIDEGWVYFKGC